MMFQLEWLLTALGALLFLILFALWLRGTFRARYRYRFVNAPAPDDPRFLDVLPGLSDSTDAPGRVTGFYDVPAAIFQARLEVIAAATQWVDLETYYMVPGKRADDLAAAMIAQAQAGVRVRFIADSQGVTFIKRAYWKRLKDAGVEVRFYNNFEWGAPFEYLSRTHRKLLLVDGRIAMIGGTGFSDEWDGSTAIHDEAPWADVEVKLEGPVVDVLQGTFLRQWACVGGEVDFAYAAAAGADGDAPIVVTTGEYTAGVSPLGVLYQACIASARTRLWLASPYFLPDTTTRNALKAAAQRGVDVRILTMGIHNDRLFVYHASRELYGELLNAGVRIFEYRPSLMHAKAMLVDDAWATMGSANLDPISFFSNAELNVSCGHRALLDPLQHWFARSLAISDEINTASWRRRGWWVWIHGKFWLRLRRIL